MCAPTDVVFIDGCQFGGVIDRSRKLFLPWNALDLAFTYDGIYIKPDDMKERHDRIFNLPEPAQRKSLSRMADLRYYKLHNGNILDTKTMTVLNREVLLHLLQT